MSNRTYYKGKVYQYSLEGEFIGEHESQKAAAESLGLSIDSVNSAVKGRAKSAGGFQFRTTMKKAMPNLARSLNATIASYEHLNKKIKVDFTDEGIINDPGHREYGRRKIVLNDMQIFCDPGKPVQEIVNKYSKTFKI